MRSPEPDPTMTTTDDSRADSGASALSAIDQPHAVVERDGIRYTLLGTAHVSHASVDAVRRSIASGRYQAVAVELDEHRHRALTGDSDLHRLDIFAIVRQGKAGLVAANLALSAYQRRIAEQLGIEPGAELKAASDGAREAGLPLSLIDREVGLTMRRVWHGLGFWGRAKLMSALLTALLVDEQVGEDEIERLKEGDLLESSFGQFASDTPPIYRALIDERDRYMAARLRAIEFAPEVHDVLVVIGAGHLKGTADYLANATDDPQAIRADLEHTPTGSRIPWFTLALAAFLIGGFAWGFAQGVDVGSSLALTWILATGIPGAIGCALAGGHPLSIAVAFLASPITPLHPALSSGMLSAACEAWLRRPGYTDFMSLRDDTGSLRGWWRNRVARTLVNFMLTNTGTALGVWAGGAQILSRVL